MIVELPCIFSEETIDISEFTIEDFRSIAFMIQNDSDQSLYNKFVKSLNKDLSSIDKFNILLESRILHIDDNIIFNNGTSNITVNINIWKEKFRTNIKDIRKTLKIDNIELTLDYPSEFFFKNLDDILMSCVKHLRIKDKFLNFYSLDKSEQLAILEKLPSNVTLQIKEFIEDNNKPIILMDSVLNLPEISINFFDNSAFSLIKTIYSYYQYDDICEILFVLSKRITDISYLNSRTPRDLNSLIRLYEEELEKLNDQNN
jgi:hypothetical protein